MGDPGNIFEILFQNSLDGVALTRPDGTVLRANSAACRALRRTEDEIRRAGRQGLVVEDEGLRDLLARREAGESVAGSLVFRRPDGGTFPAEFTSGLLPSTGDEPLSYIIFRDVTERRHIEEGLRRSNRALRLVTLCNEALVRATSEVELFAAVCNLMVEAGGYRMCWVGLAEQDKRRTVRPVAFAGHEDGYLSTVDIVWSDTPLGRGPSGTAIRTGRPVVGHDFESDAVLKPWREAAAARGYRSSTALPLVHEGERFGAIAMYAGVVEAFDEQELEILAQLSSDLAYGIHALRQRAARTAAEEALRRSEAMLKGITDTIPGPIFMKDREGRWIFANPATLAVAGRSLDQVLGRTDREIYPDPAIGEALAEIDRRIMESGRAEVVEETVQAPDGLRVYLSTKAPFRDHEGRVVGLVGAAQEITERKRMEEALREREHLLAMSQRAAHVGTWNWKLGDPKVQWSDETYRIYGLGPDTGPPDFELYFQILHPDDRAPMREWGQACAAGLQPPPVEFRVLRPDGSIRIVETAGDVIETVDGAPSRIAGTAHDVTERRRHEEALRESERRYRELFEASPVPISVAEVVCDAEGRHHDYRFLYVNTAFERFMGTTAARLVGHTILEVAPLVNRAMVERACRVALTGVPDFFEGHSVGLDKDHETTVYSPQRGQLVTFVADVTERRKAEKVRREIHDRLEKVVASAPGIVFSYQLRPDGSTRIPFGGERIAEHYGIPRARLAEDAAPFVALAHPDDLDGLLESIRESARLLVPWRREWRLRHPARGEVWIDAQSMPLREPDGSTLWHGVATDVTERKRAEADRERLAMAIEQAAETVVVTDPQGTILYVNPAFERETGYTRGEALGQNPRILKSGEQDDAFYREFWETISSGRTWQGRLVNRRKDGRLFTEEATISPVRDATGAIVSYVAVKRDITRDLAMEAQLLQSQKMEGIGRLAGGVAHDFNNVLSVILSCAGFALDGLKEGDPLREDILEIETGAKRAAALTRQLLAFSRKQVLQPVSLDLNRSLAEMEKMLRRIIGEDVDLAQHLAPDLGLVRADPGQIEQVVMNLAVNARDAMPEGGKLTIETANVTLDEEYVARHAGAKPGPHVMVAVTDSGTGMDERTLARIFEPFFTTKEVGKGSGLGLSTVYGIVKQSGGSIFVYSEVGRGTTFKVFLPLDRSSATMPVRARPPETRAGRGETVLVVEDDGSLRNITRRMLAGAGYSVLTAANGGEGLLTCEQHAGRIHLVLTDVVMPQMSGRVFAERISQVRPGMKVLYMSGYTDNAIVHHGVLDQGTHFIAKPFTQDDLLAKVREVLDGPPES